jgi:hypothetical protein
MQPSDLAIIESDRADRWLVGLILALVAAEMGDACDAAAGTYDDKPNAPEELAQTA